MADYQTGVKKKKWYHSMLFSFALLCFCIIFLVNIIHLMKKNKEAAHAKERAREELDLLLDRQKKLEDEIASLNTDEGMEKVIREQYPVAKEGEGVVIILDQSEIDKENGQEGKKESFFKKWFSGDQEE